MISIRGRCFVWCCCFAAVCCKTESNFAFPSTRHVHVECPSVQPWCCESEERTKLRRLAWQLSRWEVNLVPEGAFPDTTEGNTGGRHCCFGHSTSLFSASDRSRVQRPHRRTSFSPFWTRIFSNFIEFLQSPQNRLPALGHHAVVAVRLGAQNQPNRPGASRLARVCRVQTLLLG